jgi:flagellar basal-body rod protein FlgB
MAVVPLLKKSLGAYSARNNAIAENIANIETKGYRPYKVDFEKELQRAMQRSVPVGLKSDSRHMTIGGDVLDIQPKISTQNEIVDMEQEMAELAKNQIRFEFAIRKLSGTYEAIRSAIRGHSR